jgi:predicted extracellular nuclease
MHRIFHLITGICLFFPVYLFSQNGRQEFRVMFYNVENLFDTEDDPRTNDNEFLPESKRHWTPYRYYAHLRQTAQVINAAGEWGTPALVGLCEVENDSVLIHLLNRTPLREQRYRYCKTEGNDTRGINNALLYQRDKFKYIGHRSERIAFTRRTQRSRDILHVWGEVITGDTLDVFVCHFPSRSGGQKESEQGRLDAAKFLRKKCDSLYLVRRKTNILVMGDFNDMPQDKSIKIITETANPNRKLINLFADPHSLNFQGSYKYQGEWGQLDQMMVSLHWKSFLKEGSARIFNAPFMLIEEKGKQHGKRPQRIYMGFKYEGGYSDHLPVMADFLLEIAKK